MERAKGPHPNLKCTTGPRVHRLHNRKPLSRATAFAIATDPDMYNMRNTHDLLRVQHYLTSLTAALAEELRNRYDKGML